MPTSFTHTLCALEADRPAWATAGFLIGGLLLGGTVYWATQVEVRLYEASQAARLEVDRSVYAVASPLAGRVMKSHLVISQQVHEGDVLLELDCVAEQLEIREQEARQEALRVQIDTLQTQIVSESAARVQERQASGVGREQTRAQARQAEIAAGQAEDEERRMRQLRAEGLTAEQTYQSARANALVLRAAAQAQAIAVDHAREEQGTRDSDRASKIRSVESQIAGLTAQIPEIDAAIARLRFEIERRVVRAPVAGRVGEAATLRPGAVVKEGEKLGAIIPAGNMRAVAEFLPQSAMGRIRPGQPAQLRLDGFPWIVYGLVPAHVERVASEIRDGSVRVELGIDRGFRTSIPLQHGLPGGVEIEVERTTPWELVQRHIGRRSSELRAREMQ